MEQLDIKHVAKIYLPAKTATQSGYGNTKLWVLEIESNELDYKSQLMGWNGSKNTAKQIKIKFDSCEEAKKYAIKNNLKYRIIPHHERSIRKKNYSVNFIK